MSDLIATKGYKGPVAPDLGPRRTGSAGRPEGPSGAVVRGALGPLASLAPTTGRSVRRIHLTKRQLEVLASVAEGDQKWETAEKLGVSPNTVNTYLHDIGLKLHVHGSPSLVASGVLLGVARPDPLPWEGKAVTDRELLLISLVARSMSILEIASFDGRPGEAADRQDVAAELEKLLGKFGARNRPHLIWRATAFGVFPGRGGFVWGR